MKKIIKRINCKVLATMVMASMALAVGNSRASMINMATGYSGAGTQGDAAAYRSVVDAAVAVSTAGYGNTSLATFDNISNYSVFGSTNSNVAYAFTINFAVTAAQAGSWDFRAGVDFGQGGAIFLDGVALDFRNTNMWWNGSYADAAQSFQETVNNLSAGNHVLSIYGLEDCCDGSQQAQFRAPGMAGFVTFSSADGLSAIPEPTTFALFGISLLGFGVARKHKR